MIFAFTGLGCLALGSFLAWHYPLAPVLTSATFALWSVVVFLRPAVSLFVLPALLPVIGFASWTGWLIFEEFDLLVLGAAAGGYASMAMRARDSFRKTEGTVIANTASAPEHTGAPMARLSVVSLLLVALFGLSTVAGLYRGIADAGAMEFGWFDNYYDALNSLRLSKSFGLAVLMVPLLQVELRTSGRRAILLLASGLACALGLASMAVVWERLAFPGLLNFSSDYRATGMFWEMHVGGAALDGFLALTVPFAIWELLHPPSRWRWALAGGLTLVAGYACLATFSRGVYLAVPVSFIVLTMLGLMQRESLSATAAAAALLKACALALATAAASYLVFRSGGYRSLLAVLGVLAVTLPLGTAARNMPARTWFVALPLGAIAAAVGASAAPLIAKGPYVVFGAAFLCCAALVPHRRQVPSERRAVASVAAYIWLIVATAHVAFGWGGVAALHDSAIVLSLLAASTVWNVRASQPRWPGGLKAHGVIVGFAALIAIAAAVFGGGAYMAERFSSSERDFAGRLQHWRNGIGMLDGPADWLLGKGLGRFPQSYFFGVPNGDYPGSYRIGSLEDNRFLVLSGPRHDVGFGELFRVAQRVRTAPGGPYTVALDARAARDVRLHVELCEKHLLYVGGCAIAAVTVSATGASWQRRMVGLDGGALSRGPWYAPRLAFFALAVESPGDLVEIDNVSIIGPDGRSLLANGDFAQGMARWFFTSDHFHLPWHIKNLFLNVLFDQGVVGLLLFVMLTGAALWRLVAGTARRHPAAPFLAASLIAFLVVGAFDSLLDVPRVAFLFYLLAFLSLTLPETASPPARLR